MIAALARREIVAGLREWRFYLAVLLTVGLVAVSLFVMQGDYERRLSAYAHRLASDSGGKLLMPPAGLSVAARGLDEALGREFRFDALDRGMITVGARSERTNLLFKLFATPDLLFIFMIVMSLVAFLFSYDAVSGERAAGTLRLVLAQPVRRSSVLLGKALGRGVLFALVVLAGLLVAAVWIAGAGLVDPRGSDLPKLALFGLLTLCYLYVFFCLGLLVSTLSRRPSASLSILMLLWCLEVFVLPNLLPGIARMAHDLPSPDTMRQARVQNWVRAMFLTANAEAPVCDQAKGAWLEDDDPSTRILSDYRTRLKGLIATTRLLERLTPAGLYLEAATALAGTGLAADVKLKDQVERLSSSIRTAMGDRSTLSADRPALEEAVRNSFIPCAGLLVCEALLLLAACLGSFVRVELDGG